jgi:hypothetical protein
MDAIAYCFTVLVLAGLALYATRQWTRETREANDYALWLDASLHREAILKAEVSDAIERLNWMDRDVENLCDIIKEMGGTPHELQSYHLQQEFVERDAWGKWQTTTRVDPWA